MGNARVTFTDGTNKGDAYYDWNLWPNPYVNPNAGNTTGLNDGIITAADIKQVNHYYPFGLNMEGNWQGGAQGDNKYQYNGKQWNDDFGLGWNDYGARFYHPAMARWVTVDPLSEKAKGHSPYTYVFDNPIRYRDPDGRQAEDHIFVNSRDVVVGIIRAPGDDRVYRTETLSAGVHRVSYLGTYARNTIPAMAVSQTATLAQSKADVVVNKTMNSNGRSTASLQAATNTDFVGGAAGVMPTKVDNNSCPAASITQENRLVIGSTTASPAIAATATCGAVPALTVNTTLVATSTKLNSITSGSPGILTPTELPFNPSLTAPLIPVSQKIETGDYPSASDVQLTSRVGQVLPVVKIKD